MRMGAAGLEMSVKRQTRETKNRPRVLLLVSQPEEAEQLRQRLAVREPDFELVLLPGMAETQSYLAEGEADALVCDLAALAARDLAELAAHAPLVALVSPGGEEQAAALLTEGVADCVVKVGNYHLLLAAALRRLVQSPPLAPSPAKAGPGTPLDFDEIGMILRHEINNPLTGILGNAELVLAAGPALSPEVRRRVETIVELAVRLRNLVRNLEQMVTRQAKSRPSNPSAALPVERLARPTGSSKHLR